MRFASFKFRMQKPKAMITNRHPMSSSEENTIKRAIGFTSFVSSFEKVLSCKATEAFHKEENPITCFLKKTLK